jgi:chain length determinant protein EpsF
MADRNVYSHMGFRQFMLILRGRWWLAASILVSVLLAAAALCLLLPKQYTATASVVFDGKTEPITGAGSVVPLTASDLLTQIDIVGSDRVARRVVKTIHLDDSPQLRARWLKSTDGQGDYISWLSTILQRRVMVMPSRESNVINISVKWPDRDGAAGIANAYAQAYLDTSVDLRVEPAKQYARWFDLRSRELRAILEEKQRNLSGFQSKAQITATDERLDIESARLTELSSQLTRIEVQRQESQSHQQRIGSDNESLPEVLESPIVAHLKEDLAEAEAKEKDIATRFGQNHPDYQRNVAQIASIRAQISLEIAKIASSLGNETRTNLARESQIRAALEEQKVHVLELKQQRDELDVLKNDVVTAQRNLDAVSERLAKSSLESQVQQTNLLPLTLATAPALPSSPNYPVTLILGAIVGAVMGIGVILLIEALDPRVRSGQDLTRLLSVPLLGKVSSNRRSRKSEPPLLLGSKESADPSAST